MYTGHLKLLETIQSAVNLNVC